MRGFSLVSVFVLFIAIVIGGSERVPRAAGRNCPRNLDVPNSDRVKYNKRGTKVNIRCANGFSRFGARRLICGQDDKWIGDLPICIKSGCAPINNYNDKNLVMSFHPKFNDAIVTFDCEEDYLLFGPVQIHCDGVKWSHAPPTCKDINDLLACDFESDLCGWSQAGNQNWTRHIGSTQTGATGPKRDHTLPNSDTGHYLFFESSAPTAVGDSAMLVSPPYDSVDLSPMCFEFWYHMLGPDEQGHVGSLAVYIKGQDERLEMLQPIYYKEGNQGDMWHKGDIFIDDQMQYLTYQIIIKAVRKKSYMSDISIDDLRLYNCTTTTSTTTTTTTVTTTVTTPPTSTNAPSSTAVSSNPSPMVTNATPLPADISTRLTGSTNQPTVGGNYTSPPITGTSLAASNTPTAQTTSNPVVLSTVNTVSVTNVSSAPTTTQTNQTSPRPSQSTVTTVPVVMTSTTLPMTSHIAINGTSRMVTRRTYTPSPGTSLVTGTTTKRPTTNRPTTTLPSSKRISTLPPSTTVTPTKKLLTASTTSSTMVTSKGKQTSVILLTTPITTPRTTTPKTSTLGVTTTQPSKIITTTLPSKVTSTAITSNTTPKVSTLVTKSSSMTSPPTSTPVATQLIDKSNEPSTSVSSPTVKSSGSLSTSVKSSITTPPGLSTSSKGSNSSDPGTQRSHHPADDTLKPLMIGLGVGILVGLIVIGVIGWVCVRRRKFYTSRYEDELKPITNAASTHSLAPEEYYHDDFDIENL